MAGPPNIGPSARAKNGTPRIMANRPYDEFGGTRGISNPDPPGYKDPGDAGKRGGRSSVIYGTPPIGTKQGQGQSMKSATRRSPAIRVKMSQRLKSAGGVGGGVVSRKAK